MKTEEFKLDGSKLADMMIKRNIKINETTIQFLSPIDNKVVYTIWEERFKEVIDAINKSRKMKLDFKKLNKKYN